jgi:PhnB protein
MTLNAYLNFNGNCREAMTFYQKVLGGQIVAMFTHENTPAAGQMPADWGDKILHARLVVDGSVIMASDSPAEYFEKPQGFSVNINVESAAEAERIFAALVEGGTAVMPIEETFWALRFGMLVDRYGTPWMVNCEKPM